MFNMFAFSLRELSVRLTTERAESLLLAYGRIHSVTDKVLTFAKQGPS
jgi:hypothetical protein